MNKAEKIIKLEQKIYELNSEILINQTYLNSANALGGGEVAYSIKQTLYNQEKELRILQDELKELMLSKNEADDLVL